MSGLLLVGIIIGYEWFISGLNKLVNGGFPAGLADALQGKLDGTAPWYHSLMQSVFIPNAQAFGYAIEVAELLAGVALIVGGLIWLFAWSRISDRLRAVVLFFIALATIGGAFLALNLHFANGAVHPWLNPSAAFDEGVDLDIVLPALQIVIATISIVLFRRLRQERTSSIAPRA